VELLHSLFLWLKCFLHNKSCEIQEFQTETSGCILCDGSPTNCQVSR
jgi:hypothetical protein